MRRLLLTIVMFLALAGMTNAQDKVSVESIMSTMELANNHFINKYPNPGAPTFVKKERPSNLWTRGVYFEGLFALANMERLLAREHYNTYYMYISGWGNAHKWTPRNGTKTRDADDYCCCQTYIDMGHVGPTIECMDNLIACRNVPQKQGNGSSNGSFGDWTWIDAIQMGLPVMSKLSAVMLKRGDSDYLRYAEQGWQMYRTSRDSIAGGLFNKKEGLWWRDKDFVPPFTTPNGRQCYWSRGNGWVYAALVRAMQALPSDPHYNDYKKDYLLMTKALLKCQQPDGFWYASLADPKDFGGKELSGTALFIYGMAWGVRQGYLSAKKYTPIIFRTWNQMVKYCVHPDGILGYVQGTGKQPSDSQPVDYDKEPDFDDYGLGCFLLCGTEIVKMMSK